MTDAAWDAGARTEEGTADDEDAQERIEGEEQVCARAETCFHDLRA